MSLLIMPWDMHFWFKYLRFNFNSNMIIAECGVLAAAWSIQ